MSKISEAHLQSKQTKHPQRAEFRLYGNYPNWPIRLTRDASNKPPERADQTSRMGKIIVPMKTTELANQIDEKCP